MTQRAVRCPNVRVLLGNGRGQVLGAEPLRLLATAHLGDAMERDVPLGTRGCAEVQGDLAASGVGSDFCLRWCWQERSHVRDMFPVVSCSFGGDAAWICRGELPVWAVKGVEWCGLCGLSCSNTTRSSPELLWSGALHLAKGASDPLRVALGTGRANASLFGAETTCCPPSSSHRAFPTQEPHKWDRVFCVFKEYI